MPQQPWGRSDMRDNGFNPRLVVDLHRYPIEDRGDPRRAAVVQRLRSDLESQQYCVMPGFITEAALSAVLAEVDEVKGSAYRNRSRRNCYLYREGDAALPADHPKNLFFDASYSMIGNHLLPATSTLK